MKRNVFQFSSYLQLLEGEMQINRHVTGFQSRLAEAAGCQRSYFSQILKGRLLITSEQAFGIAKYVGLSDLELEFFLTLVAFERSGTNQLKQFYLKQLDTLRESANDLSRRVQSNEIKDTFLVEYYSAWHYMAIHVLVSVPAFDSIEKIALHLKLENAQVTEAITKLLAWGLIESKNRSQQGWKLIVSDVHLPKTSPLTKTNHTNWRLHALQKIDTAANSSLHFTSVLSLSRKDAKKIRSMILDHLVDLRDVIKKSKEEEVFALNIDWFQI